MMPKDLTGKRALRTGKRISKACVFHAGECPITMTNHHATNDSCRRCRDQKIRCSGSHPCDQCSKRNSACQFDSTSQRVLVTRRQVETTAPGVIPPNDSLRLPDISIVSMSEYLLSSSASPTMPPLEWLQSGGNIRPVSSSNVNQHGNLTEAMSRSRDTILGA